MTSPRSGAGRDPAPLGAGRGTNGLRLAAVERAASWVANLTGARRALFAALAGALSVLAFAPVHAWPVLFLTFGALVWLLDGCHAQHA